jgi:vacuolar-type H+-ATPase subunit E/Vma4
VALEARDLLLERVFERASQELSRALAAPEARAWLEARVVEALALLPQGGGRVSASSEGAAVLARALEGREDVSVETDPELSGGFRATSADGAVVIDVTAPSLIARARAGLAPEVLRGLASDRPPERGAEA